MWAESSPRAGSLRPLLYGIQSIKAGNENETWQQESDSDVGVDLWPLLQLKYKINHFLLHVQRYLHSNYTLHGLNAQAETLLFWREKHLGSVSANAWLGLSEVSGRRPLQCFDNPLGRPTGHVHGSCTVIEPQCFSTVGQKFTFIVLVFFYFYFFFCPDQNDSIDARLLRPHWFLAHVAPGFFFILILFWFSSTLSFFPFFFVSHIFSLSALLLIFRPVFKSAINTALQREGTREEGRGRTSPSFLSLFVESFTLYSTVFPFTLGSSSLLPLALFFPDRSDRSLITATVKRRQMSRTRALMLMQF